MANQEQSKDDGPGRIGLTSDKQPDPDRNGPSDPGNRRK
jgi:hypothetical protein